MAEQPNQASDENVLSRLAGRGEDALTRLVDEVAKNSRVTEALGRAMAAKGKVDETTRRTLHGVGLAPVDELRELRTRLDELDARVAKLEAAGAGRSRARAGRSPATTTKASGGTPKAAGSSSGSSRRRSGGQPPESV